MKKLITLLLVGLMLFGTIGTVFATEGTELRSEKAPRVQVIQEFKDELHQINALKIDRLNLRIDITENQDSIIDLYLVAREAGNQEAIEAAKELKQQIREVNEAIKNKHQTVVAEREAFRAAIKNNSTETAQIHLNNIIELKNDINSLLEDKIALLDEIIEVLS